MSEFYIFDYLVWNIKLRIVLFIWNLVLNIVFVMYFFLILVKKIFSGFLEKYWLRIFWLFEK